MSKRVVEVTLASCQHKKDCRNGSKLYRVKTTDGEWAGLFVARGAVEPAVGDTITVERSERDSTYKPGTKEITYNLTDAAVTPPPLDPGEVMAKLDEWLVLVRSLRQPVAAQTVASEPAPMPTAPEPTPAAEGDEDRLPF